MFGLSICLLACVTLWAFEAAGLDLCKDYRVHFERVITVPQEAALLTCHLVDKHLFDVVNTPYNVTWYDQRTGLQITGEEDHTVVNGASLWFLNSTVEHQGEYLCVVRTPESCYKQAVVLKVSQPNPRECGRPQSAPQFLKSSVNGNLACPLNDYAARVTSYSIQWYKGCELLQEGPKFAFIGNKLILLIRDVSHTDVGLYTCRMTFVLSGVVSEAAETIECMISEAFKWKPQIIEPTNEDIKVTPGSRFMKRCRVFVPGGRADHLVMASWVFNESFVSQDTSDRIYQTPQNESYVENGYWVERTLLVSSVLQDDFNQNFTCKASNGHGDIVSQVRLQSAETPIVSPFSYRSSSSPP